jgi:DNA-binding NarL/FixJ family response regulator
MSRKTNRKIYSPPPVYRLAALLTRRELEVLRLIAADMKNKEIGEALSITQGTVKIHVHNILLKLGVNSRTGAITRALAGHLL